jgi:hypothetical protein
MVGPYVHNNETLGAQWDKNKGGNTKMKQWRVEGRNEIRDDWLEREKKFWIDGWVKVGGREEVTEWKTLL